MCKSVFVVLALPFVVWGKSVTPFAEHMFGVWAPKKGVPTRSILGPVAYDFLGSGPGKMKAGFTALRDDTTGDVWFTLLNGQQWRTSGNQTQYCFGTKVLAEQSPFEVQQITDTSVNICWRSGDRGMPTHTKGCKGCDCARIFLNLTDADTLSFTFWMSPPVIHADLVFTRSGPAPTMKDAIQSTMLFPYLQCRVVDHYGPNIPGEPDLRNRTYQLPGACGSASRRVAEGMMKDDELPPGFEEVVAEPGADSENSIGQCRQLNGLNLLIDSAAAGTDKAMNVSDVRLQYIPPSGACNPCDVSYSVSAKTGDDEYIGVGFKGESWEGKDPYPPEVSRPCYFGMCVDEYDNFTSDRMAVGYSANGGCVREMVTSKVIGAPSDASYKILKNTGVERSGDRTILRFTASQHWPRAKLFTDGPFRVMWAIGKVSAGKGCQSEIGYHFNHRGVAPTQWLTTLGSTPCKYNPAEMAGTAELVA